MEEFRELLADFLKRIIKLEKNTTNSRVILPTDGVLRPPVLTADPASPTDGDIWYRSDTDVWRGRKNGATVTFTTS